MAAIPAIEIEANPDLGSLRKDPRYREIMAEAQKVAQPSSF
jgi:hypothetical protein